MTATKHGVFHIAEFKAAKDDPQGRFSALVSVFGNVDLGGDRVVKGAFTKSLERWRDKGDPIPVIWSHDWANPNAHIGYANPSEVTETDDGLKVDGTLDLDNPFAAQVYRLLSQRRVKEMSFGYSIQREKTAEDGANELLEVDILEVGPTLKGMNPDTQLLGVKAELEAAAKEEVEYRHNHWAMSDGAIEAFESFASKAGRTISKANESKIRGAISALQEVLSSLGVADEDDDEKNSPASAGATGSADGEVEANGKAGEPVEANGKASTDDELLSLKATLKMMKEM